MNSRRPHHRNEEPRKHTASDAPDRLACEDNKRRHPSENPHVFIGVSRYEDCRNRAPHLDEAPVKLEARHR
jgi:hypothetical protein